MLSASTYVKGSNHIGKSESDIQRLIENSNRYEDDSGRGNRRGRGGNSRGGDRNRRDSRGGDRKQILEAVIEIEL